MAIAKFLAEVKRRCVPQVVVGYAAAAFVIAQVADFAAPGLHLPEWTVTFVLLLLILGFPLALVLAWVFDVGPRGIERMPESDAPPAPAPLSAASVAAAGTPAHMFVPAPARSRELYRWREAARAAS